MWGTGMEHGVILNMMAEAGFIETCPIKAVKLKDPMGLKAFILSMVRINKCSVHYNENCRISNCN